VQLLHLLLLSKHPFLQQRQTFYAILAIDDAFDLVACPSLRADQYYEKHDSAANDKTIEEF
jgi:hypothetical protein